MKYIEHPLPEPIKETIELIETIRFSLETVNMALCIGKGPRRSQRTLNNYLANSSDSESKEAGLVAVEALATARTAFLRMAEIFDSEENETTGFNIGFWSTFEWCWYRLFTEQAHTTGQLVLQYEVAEALRRSREMECRLNGHTSERFTN